jgi:hypothetical protein
MCYPLGAPLLLCRVCRPLTHVYIHMKADGFVTYKKSLNVLSLDVKGSPAHFSRIVEATSFGQFLHL